MSLSDYAVGDAATIATPDGPVRAVVIEVCADRVRVDVTAGPVVVRLTYSPDGLRLIGHRIDRAVPSQLTRGVA